MSYFAIVPAAGVGERMQSAIPKQYMSLAGKPVMQWAIELLLQLPQIKKVMVVLHPADQYWPTLGRQYPNTIMTVVGGSTRAASVYQALLSLSSIANASDWVLVHDAVRPCVPLDDIYALFASLSEFPQGAILAHMLHDTVKQVNVRREITQTVAREQLWRAATPQVFPYATLFSALQRASEKDFLGITDEASALESMQIYPGVVPCSPQNIKITTADDLEYAAWLLTKRWV